jgi:hypothetical protein
VGGSPVFVSRNGGVREGGYEGAGGSAGRGSAGEGGGKVKLSEVFEDTAYVKDSATNINFLLREKRWDEAIETAQGAIDTLKGLQRYAGEQRNKSIADYCNAHPGYIPF